MCGSEGRRLRAPGSVTAGQGPPGCRKDAPPPPAPAQAPEPPGCAPAPGLTSDLRVVRDAHDAAGVVGRGGDFPRTTSPVPETEGRRT